MKHEVLKSIKIDDTIHSMLKQESARRKLPLQLIVEEHLKFMLKEDYYPGTSEEEALRKEIKDLKKKNFEINRYISNDRYGAPCKYCSLYWKKVREEEQEMHAKASDKRLVFDNEEGEK